MISRKRDPWSLECVPLASMGLLISGHTEHIGSADSIFSFQPQDPSRSPASLPLLRPLIPSFLISLFLRKRSKQKRPSVSSTASKHLCHLPPSLLLPWVVQSRSTPEPMPLCSCKDITPWCSEPSSVSSNFSPNY